MSKCKSCGAEIKFIKTPLGKWMPCDMIRHTFRKDMSGNEVFVTDAGDVVHGIRCDSFEADSVGYISHFATCPYANQHRRR